MDDSAYRSDALLPLAGARVYTLTRQGGQANMGLMAVWGGTILFAVGIGSALDGNVPEAILPFVGLPIVLGGLVAAWLVYKRMSNASSSFRIHVAGARRVLEQTVPPAAYDLSRLPLRATRYEWTARATRGGMPTVTIELPTGTTLVVTGPMGVGWENLSEHDVMLDGRAPGPAPERSRAPDVRLDDAQAFEALRTSVR